MLSGLFFYRIDNENLINMNYIVKYLRAGGGYILMKDGSQISIAGNTIHDLIKQLKQTCSNMLNHHYEFN